MTYTGNLVQILNPTYFDEERVLHSTKTVKQILRYSPLQTLYSIDVPIKLLGAETGSKVTSLCYFLFT